MIVVAVFGVALFLITQVPIVLAVALSRELGAALKLNERLLARLEEQVGEPCERSPDDVRPSFDPSKVNAAAIRHAIAPDLEHRAAWAQRLASRLNLAGNADVEAQRIMEDIHAGLWVAYRLTMLQAEQADTE